MLKRKAAILIALFAALMMTTMIARGDTDSSGKGWLGIYTQTIDPDLQEAFELDSDYGVMVKKVIDDSPAEKAGLMKGDIIVEFNDRRLDDADQLIDLVRKNSPGDEIAMTVWRDGKKVELEITLGEYDDDKYDKADYRRNIMKYGPGPKSHSKTFQWFDEKVSDVYMGVNLQNLNAQLGDYFGVKDGKGALISEVMEDSPAAEADLKAGDIIIAIGDTDVASPSDVIEVVNDHEEDDRVELKILRDKKVKKVAVTLKKRPDSYYSFRRPDMMFFDDDRTFMPKMKDIFRSDHHDAIFFDDDDDTDDELDELKEEIRILRKELQEIREQLK